MRMQCREGRTNEGDLSNDGEKEGILVAYMINKREQKGLLSNRRLRRTKMERKS